MTKWFLVFLMVFSLAGCSLWDAEIVDEQPEIPKSYSLAIGYLNEAKWDKAEQQLLQTIENSDSNETYVQAANLLLAHVTNAALLAYEEVGNSEAYQVLFTERKAVYERLLDMEGTVENSPFLGLNFNLTVAAVEGEEQQHTKIMGDYIVANLGDIFDESPVDTVLLLEQSSNAITAGDAQFAALLVENK